MFSTYTYDYRHLIRLTRHDAHGLELCFGSISNSEFVIR
jgi:D-mannonate dehydratase